jgi:hypothetical protein
MITQSTYWSEEPSISVLGCKCKLVPMFLFFCCLYSHVLSVVECEHSHFPFHLLHLMCCKDLVSLAQITGYSHAKSLTLLNECHGRVVHIMEVSGICLNLETQQVGSSNNASDLYSVGAWVKSQLTDYLDRFSLNYAITTSFLIVSYSLFTIIRFCILQITDSVK